MLGKVIGLVIVITTVALLLFLWKHAWVQFSVGLVEDKRSETYSRRVSRTPPFVPVYKEISTTRESSHILYGVGVASQRTTRQLSRYIRALTSRPAPGSSYLHGVHGRQDFSQIGQSQFVDKLLKKRRGGVFLECGAADGEDLSNSLFFEVHRNWSGVLIEGNPYYHRTLLSKNRNAFVVRACLSLSTKPQTVKYMVDGVYSGIVETESKPTSQVKSIDVQCFSLNSITAALGIRHIDYISLDIEGPELAVLKTIDWSQLSVDVFSIEYGEKPHKLNQFRSFFNATGKYKEVGLLPLGRKDGTAQDVVFMRTQR